MNILDLREGKKTKQTHSEINWIVAWTLAFMVIGIAYLVWLDHGCALNGIMTWTGKVCVQ